MSYIAELPYVGWVIPFLVVLGVVVFVHEYGHYIVGKWCGIKAEVFSIGFGKELFYWIDKNGMRWRVGLLPLGGYVKFKGDMNAASTAPDPRELARLSAEERQGAFHLAPVWARALTVLAGPVANFLLSIVVFMGLALFAGKPLNEPVIGGVADTANAELGLQAGDRVISVDGQFVETFNELLEELEKHDGKVVPALIDRGRGEETIEVRFSNPARIDEVIPGGAAAAAGLKAGDIVSAVDGAPTPNFGSLRDAVLGSGGAELALTVLRGGETLELSMTPQLMDTVDENGDPEERPMIGVRSATAGGIEAVVEPAGVVDSLLYGVSRTLGIIAATLGFIYDAFAGEADTSQLGGPIQIAKVSGQAAEQGIDSLIIMIALISTSIGLINLFPIPVLDGGHLVFYSLEALMGRPVRARWQEIGNGLGLGMILLLMVFATYNDLLR